MLRFDSFQKNKTVEDDIIVGGHTGESASQDIPTGAAALPERSLVTSTTTVKNDSLSDLMRKELDGDAANGHDSSTPVMPHQMTQDSSSCNGRGGLWRQKKPSVRPPLFTSGLSGLTIVTTKREEVDDKHARSSDRSLVSKAESASTHNDPSVFLWQELDAAFVEACPPHNAAVQHILKLCFSSLCVVFRETKLNRNDDSNKHPFLYERIPSIPAVAAQMLWSELLGGIECVKKEGDLHYQAQLKQTQPAPHGDVEEDSPEATVVPLGCDPAVTPEEVQKFIRHVNDTARAVPSSLEKMLRRISVFGSSSDLAGSPSVVHRARSSVIGISSAQPTSKSLSTPKWFSFRSSNNNARNQVSQGQISMSKLQEQDRQERPQGKNLLLYCIRDHLVQVGFVEIAGRRVDDDEEDEDEDEDEVDSLCSSDDEASVSSHDREDGRMKNVDVDDELAMDFSGWGKHRKTRKVKRTQYLQIHKDMKHMYGVHLASLSESDGGFAVEASDDESLAVERSSLELETMKRWDEDMVQACVRQLQSDFVLLDSVISICHRRSAVPYSIEIQSEQNISYGNDLRDSSGDKGNESHHAKRDWWVKLRSDNPFRDASTYAIRYYPTHLMRSGHVVDTAHLLMSSRFFLSRVCAFGPSEAVQLHTANLDELKERSNLAVKGLYELGGDGDCIDPEDIIFAAMQVMTKAMEERFPLPVRIKKCRKLKGEHNDGDIGRAYHHIASLLVDKEDAMLASGAYEMALAYKVASLGENHISVARTYRHKGHIHLNQHEYDKAIHCYREAVKIERFQDEVDYKKVILSLNSIAVIHGMRQEHEEAIDSYSQSLVIQKAHLGETHPQVAETLNSLGIIYGMRGDYDRAVVSYKEALGIKLDGAGHTECDEVADIQFNLGLVQFKRGDNEAAVEAFQEALHIRQALVGEEHEEVARVLYHLGVVLEEMGELVEAAEQYEECLRLRRRIVGDSHEEVAHTLHTLGLVYFENGDYKLSLERFEDALRLRRERSGATGKVADILHAVGMVYQKTLDFDRAVECYCEAVEIRRSELGNNHIEVASTLHNMGDIYYMMGELDRAMECYEEAFDIRVGHLGNDNVDVAATRNNMGVVFMKRNEHQQAMECFSAALLTRQKQLGPNHEKVSDTLHNMGLVHKNLQEYPQAIERYEQALRIRRQHAQNEHDKIKVADTLYNMAIVFANTEHYRSALDRYKEALRTYRGTGMTDDHPSVLNTLQWIQWTEKKLHKQQTKGNIMPSSSSQ